MIFFFILAFIMALSVAWLLAMPLLFSALSKAEKRKSLSLIIVAVILFPFTSYYLITF